MAPDMLSGQQPISDYVSGQQNLASALNIAQYP